MFSVAGRSVVVTGASRGIGKGIARVFAQQGAKVLIAARDPSKLAATAQELQEMTGGQVIAQACDVSQWEQVQELMARAEQAYGGLDILCANAGIFPQKRLEDLAPEEWDEVLATNLKGCFLCVKAAIPAFQRRGRGRVVLTSSITGPITGFPGWTHYGASKAGQLGFLRTAALELARYGVTINAVLPGNILTEGLAGLGDDYLRQMAASIPLRRLGRVEDVAYAALFLASDEVGYITGQTLVVDGGQILPESLEALQSI
ncbi:MAG: 3-oxoacyl-ACP reductase FabG [Gloeomargarita sp. SKYBB_i_bin120]|nr:3-oxoacyl-ACP reductase FabG [Gloeomargarita sp. SKYG98]MCS7293584.1 3-oxoacyl-ACP reductase FabG [Gloeomargarita sp. SKYB120]MDW8179150.1 3-oxoacyl-ACP reductase FabG [Gloeomargarita sp. SKYBB_i_bin120]